jgi:primosomal protein N' (replication factor Y)
LPAGVAGIIILAMQKERLLHPSASKRFAKVALPVPVDKIFTYAIPDDAEGLEVGSRVEVPFGSRTLVGFVTALAAKSEVPDTRPIGNVLDVRLPEVLLKLARWMADYYGCAFGEALASILPPGVKGPRRVRRKTTPDGSEYERSSLEVMEGKITRLTGAQKRALAEVEKAILAGGFRPFLLHGVTGSGKTEVYIRAAKTVVRAGGGCIILVPEIGLIPQALVRYRSAFGDEMEVIHSRLTGVERHRIWKKVEKGEVRIVLGPRSAVFSPVRDLKLVIVDEEQDDSYKQEDKPRYHARNIALMRGKLEGLTVLLGSATPSAESFHHAKAGKYTYLSLSGRIGGIPMPRVHVVDMRNEEPESGVFSAFLLDRLEKCVSSGAQSILFLNKRGHARLARCRACGWTAKCTNCDISLVYHRVDKKLKCHFCGFNTRAGTACPECGSPGLLFAGVGTQRLEVDLAGLFPGAGILRMDADTTRGKEGHRRILEKFGTGEYKILLGTQMVTKGHHFPGVKLVGILSAEEELAYPDFRSTERTFQQLLQVSGRAGRVGGRGDVVIQTYMPDHYLFKFLGNHDYEGFMSEELTVRRRLRYPPFSRLISAVCMGPNAQVVERVAQAWAEDLRDELAGAAVEVLGPVPPIIERMKGRYRRQILIKGNLSPQDKRKVLAMYEEVRRSTKGRGALELRWDVDPQSFL